MNVGTRLEALVVGGLDFGEADRIVHLLTENGKIGVFANGARKSKRRFSGALELFTTIRVELGRATGRQGMARLQSAEVLRSRFALTSDLAKVCIGSYVVELAGAVSPEGLSAGATLELATTTLDALTNAKADAAFRRSFELRLLAPLGYQPDLVGCVRCGAITDRIHFDVSQGGILCESHAGQAKEIGPKTLEWMQVVQGKGGAVIDAEWANTAAGRLGTMLDQFYEGLVGKPLKSLKLVTELGL